ncbi:MULTISPECIES: hypothetical protein [Kocuria]|uniref:hypothetical protein n=1 Tax=Kocuria TaxID=57493 RepID=UPI000AC06835|nr:hypothetical protein [Kocuria polaris]
MLGDAGAADRPDAVAAALVHGGVPPPTGLAVVREDLEAYFLRLVGAQHRQERPGDR